MNIEQLKAEAYRKLEYIKSGLGSFSYAFVGSAGIVPEPKDLDILVLVSDLGEALQFFNDFGCDQDGTETYDTVDTWFATRYGLLNFIVTDQIEWFDRAQVAQDLCQTLQLQDKQQRKLVWQIILHERTGAEAVQVI